MNYRLPTVTLTTLLLVFGCKTAKLPISKLPTTATITEEGFLTCFTAGTSIDSKPVWCEASAVLYDGKNLFFANDKDMPAGQSSVFMNTEL